MLIPTGLSTPRVCANVAWVIAHEMAQLSRERGMETLEAILDRCIREKSFFRLPCNASAFFRQLVFPGPDRSCEENPVHAQNAIQSMINFALAFLHSSEAGADDVIQALFRNGGNIRLSTFVGGDRFLQEVVEKCSPATVALVADFFGNHKDPADPYAAHEMATVVAERIRSPATLGGLLCNDRFAETPGRCSVLTRGGRFDLACALMCGRGSGLSRMCTVQSPPEDLMVASLLNADLGIFSTLFPKDTAAKHPQEPEWEKSKFLEALKSAALRSSRVSECRRFLRSRIEFNMRGEEDSGGSSGGGGGESS